MDDLTPAQQIAFTNALNDYYRTESEKNAANGGDGTVDPLTTTQMLAYYALAQNGDLTDADEGEDGNRAWVRGVTLDICETCKERVNGRDDSTTEVFEAVTAAFHPVACSGTVIVEELDRLGDSCNLCLTPHGDGTIYAASAQPRKTA